MDIAKIRSFSPPGGPGGTEMTGTQATYNNHFNGNYVTHRDLYYTEGRQYEYTPNDRGRQEQVPPQGTASRNYIHAKAPPGSE